MNRVLSFYPFITAALTIAISLAICFFNMYLLSKHKRSYYTRGLHIVSIFVVCGLVFNMMNKIVFVLPLEDVYKHLSHISFMLAVISFISAVVILVYGQKQNYKNLSPNIDDALSKIDDVVFVVDRDGTITHINHPEKYNGIFGGINNIDKLLDFMKSYCIAKREYGNSIENMEVAFRLELKNSDKHFIFQITPIEVSGSRLGYTAVLEDVSAIKESERTLYEQNDYLKEANKKLSNYVRVAGALEAENERLQILEHVQLTLIGEIEKALSSLRNIKQYSFMNGTYKTDMKKLAGELRQVYGEVRNAVGKIAGKDV